MARMLSPLCRTVGADLECTEGRLPTSLLTEQVRRLAICAAVGVGAFVIHGWFLAQGRPEFRTPVSLTVLSAALATSLLLGWASIATLRAPVGE